MPVKTTAVSNDSWKRFLRAPTESVPRLFGRSFGEVGTGKTHFWLTAPGPIVVLSLDKGLQGVVEQFSEDKPIYLKEYDWAPTDDSNAFTQADAVSMRDEFIIDFEHSCTVAKTVLIDKESDVWELFRYAEFGSPKADIPRDFAALNQRYKRVMAGPKALTLNVGFIQSVKAEWGSATKKTGGSRAWGFSELDALVHVNIEHFRDDTQDGAKRFGLTIGKCRGPGALQLMGTSWNALDVPTLGQMVFPATEPEDWE